MPSEIDDLREEARAYLLFERAIQLIRQLVLPAETALVLLHLAELAGGGYGGRWGSGRAVLLRRNFSSISLASACGFDRETYLAAVAQLHDSGIVFASTDGIILFPGCMDEAQCVALFSQFSRQNKTTKGDLKRRCVEAWNCECTYCHRQGTLAADPDGQPWHLDRIMPGVVGGRYTADNVALSCAHCNMSKRHDLDWTSESLASLEAAWEPK